MKRKRQYRMRMVRVRDGKELPLAKTIKPIIKKTETEESIRDHIKAYMNAEKRELYIENKKWKEGYIGEEEAIRNIGAILRYYDTAIIPLYETLIKIKELDPNPIMILPPPKEGYEYSFDRLSSQGIIEVRKKEEL